MREHYVILLLDFVILDRGSTCVTNFIRRHYFVNNSVKIQFFIGDIIKIVSSNLFGWPTEISVSGVYVIIYLFFGDFYLVESIKIKSFWIELDVCVSIDKGQ